MLPDREDNVVEALPQLPPPVPVPFVLDWISHDTLVPDGMG